jgi:hypothetical protein
MLADPNRHESLSHAPWDAAAATSALRGIASDLEHELGDDATWPWHPLDEPAPDEPRPTSMYLGASGVAWALWYLQQAGAITLRLDPLALIRRIDAAHARHPDTGCAVPSYFLGTSGLLLVRRVLTNDPDAAERLHAAVDANVHHPSNEPLWGASGSMLAALHMHERTAEARWRDLYLRNADALRSEWQPAGEGGAHLWTQDLYGARHRWLGAAHGFAGNAFALLRGQALLPAGRRDELHQRCIATALATARFDDDRANWPPEPARGGAGATKMLVQWCHGAPGIVTSLARVPPGLSPAFDRLLLAAGETIWSAGPLAKGPGLCHGTAGNGYAFLKLYERTGDERWLERARAFAMHAIAQSAAAKARHGRRRCTLWTGDAGLACYLWHCRNATSALPLLDEVAPRPPS